MDASRSGLVGSQDAFYKAAMKKVGDYNQSQNGGNGYNKGYPFYREKTYSGSYIYLGYYGNFYGIK